MARGNRSGKRSASDYLGLTRMYRSKIGLHFFDQCIEILQYLFINLVKMVFPDNIFVQKMAWLLGCSAVASSFENKMFEVFSLWAVIPQETKHLIATIDI